MAPKTGLPIDAVVDINGVTRLAVDANVTLDAQNIDISVELDASNDSVAVVDPNTGANIRVEPNGSINSNVEVDAADGDNIAIHDTDGDELAINPDGSINAIASTLGTFKSLYNEITSTASSVLTTLQTYTVPALTSAFLQKVEVSGSNIAEYRLEINSTIQDKKRTYFGSSLNTEFKFAEIGPGIPLEAGDVVTVKVIHIRPTVGDFNSRLQVSEV